LRALRAARLAAAIQGTHGAGWMSEAAADSACVRQEDGSDGLRPGRYLMDMRWLAVMLHKLLRALMVHTV
jgi:hypothetical protein